MRLFKLQVEDILSKNRYLTGPSITEADIRLFTTLVRFDWVYHGHFKVGVHTLCTGPSTRLLTTLVRFD